MLVAIDTSTDTSSLALHDGFQLRVEHTWEAPRRHTVELLPRLATAFDRLGISADDLSGIAVARGPGSFTGLRVGMAIGKGLALARGVPIVGIPTLDVIAYAQGRDERPLCAVLKAGRGRICAASYHWADGEWISTDGPYLTTWQALVEGTDTATRFCGEIDKTGGEALHSLGKLAELVPAAARLRRAGYLAELGWQRLNRDDVDDPATLAPVYLHYPV